MTPAIHLFILVLALATDRLVGEPRWLWSRVPHPVAVIGRCIAALDAGMNDMALPFAARRRRGVAAVLLLVAAGAGLGGAAEFALHRLPFGSAVEAVLLAILLAQKSLLDHISAVAQGLETNGLAEGRRAVALVVGRDVAVLDQAGVSRAAIESAAENFSDGVIAPALWFALLGLPGVLLFKIVNTADSMIGNRSPRHAAFGWAAARLDDLINFVPARLAAGLIVLAAAAIGGDRREAVAATLRDARLHKSPNAGWPEAAAAGALGLALGGPRRYGELAVDGAWLNRGGREHAGPQDIRAALRLIDAAWALLVVMAALAGLIALWIAR